MPGEYDAEKRVFTLTADLSRDRVLAAATLIHGVVTDLLYQNGFGEKGNEMVRPELVDLAVVGTGLGVLQTNIGFVDKANRFWDSTQWDVLPRPFLDDSSLAYATALAAWVRGDNNPSWASDLRSDVKKPMLKSLKFLLKTGDSFFSRESASQSILDQAQRQWIELAASRSVSTQVVATRHLEMGDEANSPAEKRLLEKLRSGNQAVLLQAIATTHRFTAAREPMIEELRLLVEHRNDETRAAAMLALLRLAPLDEHSVNVAAKMLDCTTKFVSFAGLMALGTLETIPDHLMPAANRGFVRSLQTCNYEFVGIYVAAFERWLDDPKSHFEDLLAADSPEYLEIALQSLENLPQPA